MTACVRACVRLRQHLADCEAPETCRGCLPRGAEYGLLCWPCHRRFQLMLTQAEIVERWLTGNLPAGEGAAKVRQDWEQARSSDGSPAPIKVGIFDVRRHIADSLSEYVEELCTTHSLKGPDLKGARTDGESRESAAYNIAANAKYLLTWLDRVEAFEFVGDWFEHLAELMSEAHALAPWRPEAVRQQGIPCPDCEECALVIHGGEDDVVCLRCRAMMTPPQFRLWKLALKQEAEKRESERVEV